MTTWLNHAGHPSWLFCLEFLSLCNGGSHPLSANLRGTEHRGSSDFATPFPFGLPDPWGEKGSFRLVHDNHHQHHRQPQPPPRLYHNCQGRGAIRENPKHSLRNGCGSKGVRLTTTMVAVASTLFVEKLQLRHNMVELCANWHAFSKWAPHTTASGAGVNPSKGSGVKCFSSVYNCSCSVTQTGHLPSSGTLGREVALWCPRCLEERLWAASVCAAMSADVRVRGSVRGYVRSVDVSACPRMWLQISVDVWIFMLRCSETLLGVGVVENIHMPCESCAHPPLSGWAVWGVAWLCPHDMSAHVRVCQQMPIKRNRCNRITPGAVLSAV